MVLAETPGPSGLGCEVLIEKLTVSRDRGSVFLTLIFAQIVIEQVVGYAHAIKQVTSGEIDVRFAPAISPDVVAHRGIHVLLRCGKNLWITVDFVCKCSLCDGQRDIVLRAAFLCRRRRRNSAKHTKICRLLLPPFFLCPMSFGAKRTQFLLSEVHTRMHTDQLWLQSGVKRCHFLLQKNFSASGVFRAQRFVGALPLQRRTRYKHERRYETYVTNHFILRISFQYREMCYR